ncbi:MAG TPA: type II toxin-antitoxin system HicA family toxin [Ignavibacteria bacterium]|nr:type II toxin-antitoxin system HicA family toxin [Ignavibacteria bacterium]
MKIPRDVSAKELIKSLEHIGYSIERQKGSHITLRYEKDSKIHNITIPNHNPIKLGTLNNILKDISIFFEISKEKLMEMLF